MGRRKRKAPAAAIKLPPKIAQVPDEHLYMRPGRGGVCEVHDWPTRGLARRLVVAMRASFPDGIDVCVHCVSRAKEDAGDGLRAS